MITNAIAISYELGQSSRALGFLGALGLLDAIGLLGALGLLDALTLLNALGLLFMFLASSTTR